MCATQLKGNVTGSRDKRQSGSSLHACLMANIRVLIVEELTVCSLPKVSWGV